MQALLDRLTPDHANLSLASAIDPARIPRHIAIIVDGNPSVAAARAVVETCAWLGVETLTLPFEAATLAELPWMMRQEIRFHGIGHLDSLPAAARAELDLAIRRTANNTGLRLNLAVNYGGRGEIVDAIQLLIRENAAITEESIAAHLYTAGQPDPDLLIRTSGETRVSNFLLWQIAYAELYITPTPWSDFRQHDLLEAILEYQGRDRRFGGLPEP